MRRLLARILHLLAGLAAFATALSLTGQIVRDPSATWAFLFYLPLPLCGATLLLLDLLLLGRTLRRPRFLFSGIGVACLAGGLLLTTGLRSGTPCPGSLKPIHFIQWNVRWGGGRGRTPETWHSMTRDIISRSPDVVVLSESPEEPWVDAFLARAGSAWRAIVRAPEGGAAHWYRVAVCSRHPLHAGTLHPLRNGMAMSVYVDVASGQPPLHVLAVDGVSDTGVWRIPFLQDISAICESARQRGEPVDVIAGDFNSPGRSRGMDGLRAQGFQLAGDYAGIRSSYPSRFPLYDIDHVWVDGSWHVESAQFFFNRHTDHRGQRTALWR